MKLVKDQTFFYLYRSAYNVNDLDQLIVEMKVVEENGKLIARSQSEKVNWIHFEVTEKKIADLTRKKKPHIFETRTDALSQYTKETQAQIGGISNMSKEELIKMLFQCWDNEGTGISDMQRRGAMIEKIYNEFGVRV